jgi:hypothetical protein
MEGSWRWRMIGALTDVSFSMLTVWFNDASQGVGVHDGKDERLGKRWQGWFDGGFARGLAALDTRLFLLLLADCFSGLVRMRG